MTHTFQVLVLLLILATVAGTFTSFRPGDQLACAVNGAVSTVAGAQMPNCDTTTTASSRAEPTATPTRGSGLFTNPLGQGTSSGTEFAAADTSPAYWDSCAPTVGGGRVLCLTTTGQVVECREFSEGPGEEGCGARTSIPLARLQCAIDSGAASAQGGLLCVVPGLGTDPAGQVVRCSLITSSLGSADTRATCQDTNADTANTLDPAAAKNCVQLFQLKRFETVFSCQNDTGAVFRCTAPGVRATTPTECGSRTFDTTEMDCAPPRIGAQATCSPKGAGQLQELTCTVFSSAQLPADTTSSVLGEPQHCHVPTTGGLRNPGALGQGCPTASTSGQQPGRGLKGKPPIDWWTIACPIMTVMFVLPVRQPVLPEPEPEPEPDPEPDEIANWLAEVAQDVGQDEQAQNLQAQMIEQGQVAAEALQQANIQGGAIAPVIVHVGDLEIPDGPNLALNLAGVDFVYVAAQLADDVAGHVVLAPDQAAALAADAALAQDFAGFNAGLQAAAVAVPQLAAQAFAGGHQNQPALHAFLALGAALGGAPLPAHVTEEAQLLHGLLMGHPGLAGQVVAGLHFYAQSSPSGFVRDPLLAYRVALAAAQSRGIQPSVALQNLVRRG